MTQAKNDRNTVRFGPSRTPISYKLDRVEEQVKDLERDVVNLETGGGFEIGEITGGGTQVIIDGTEYPINNGTGFTIGDGDTVTIVVIDDSRYAITIVQRSGNYIPGEFENPQTNNDFPYDGDALPTQHNFALELPTGGSAYFGGTSQNTMIGFYDVGVLGYAGRVVVMLGAANRTAQPTITIYDVETGGVTNINRTAAVGTTNQTRGLGVVGTRLFVTYDGTSGNCVESWDSTTGTWTTHAISHAVFAGISDNRAWWVGYSSGGTRYRIHSIDGSGTLSSIDYPVNLTWSSSIGASSSSWVFAKAKNGRLWVSIQTTTQANNRLVTCLTNVAAASATLVNNASPCAATLSATWGGNGQFLWSRVLAAGNTSFRDMTQAEVSADIAANGDLWYALRAGTPECWGFAIIDATTYTQTVYGTLMSATGGLIDGEPTLFGGFCIASSNAVFFGSVLEEWYDPILGRSNSFLPTYWRSDGVTTTSWVDDSYMSVIATGPFSDGVNVTARAALIPRYDAVDSSFFFLKNIGDNIEGANITAADLAGPCVIEGFTI
jgi:hypothetical protein